MYMLSQNRHIRFSIMHKVSYMLAKRFSQDLLFANNIPLEKINYPSVTLIISAIFETKKYSSQQQQVKQEMKIWSQMNQFNVGKNTNSNPCYLQSFQTVIIQGPSYQTNTTRKLNEYINKLTLPYFNSFCQPFHIPFFYNNIFDQRLFCCYEKLFQPEHKNFIKIKI